MKNHIQPDEVGYWWWRHSELSPAELCEVKSLKPLSIKFKDGSIMTDTFGIFLRADKQEKAMSTECCDT